MAGTTYTWRETVSISGKLLDYLKDPANTITDVKRATWAMTLRLPVPEGHPQYVNNAQLEALRDIIISEVPFTTEEHDALMFRNGNVRKHIKGQIIPWFDINVNKPAATPHINNIIDQMVARDMSEDSAIDVAMVILRERKEAL
jgi:hypothetical protein